LQKKTVKFGSLLIASLILLKGLFAIYDLVKYDIPAGEMTSLVAKTFLLATLFCIAAFCFWLSLKDEDDQIANTILRLFTWLYNLLFCAIYMLVFQNLNSSNQYGLNVFICGSIVLLEATVIVWILQRFAQISEKQLVLMRLIVIAWSLMMIVGKYVLPIKFDSLLYFSGEVAFMTLMIFLSIFTTSLNPLKTSTKIAFNTKKNYYDD
jgi:hypothetical protein